MLKFGTTLVRGRDDSLMCCHVSFFDRAPWVRRDLQWRVMMISFCQTRGLWWEFPARGQRLVLSTRLGQRGMCMLVGAVMDGWFLMRGESPRVRRGCF